MFSRREALRLSTLAMTGLAAGCTTTGRSLASSAPALSPSALIDDVAERTFRFFWNTTNPKNGLAPDRYPTPSFASIAAVGFALTAYPIGVERGWVSRAEAAERTRTTLRFFWTAPQGPDAQGMSGHKGFFYHFLDMETGARYRDVELSTIDTALLFGGILFAANYFGGSDPVEVEIRDLALKIYSRADWPWFCARGNVLSMGWHPGRGFLKSEWVGYNEGMILYVQALGSPTHPLPSEAWQAWCAGYGKDWTDSQGIHRLGFPPLFGHQYSHVWVDFRGIQDDAMRSAGLDYFENSRRAALAQRAYAIENPMGWTGYGKDVWGLTACDGPVDAKITIKGEERQFRTYSARGPGEFDDGTIAPTAALGSIAFAPREAAAAAHEMYRRYGSALYGQYGFLDSFNPSVPADHPVSKGKMVSGIGWVDDDYLGIDQGPILAMIENQRSGLIWTHMRRDPHIRAGLKRAGFTDGWLDRA